MARLLHQVLKPLSEPHFTRQLMCMVRLLHQVVAMTCTHAALKRSEFLELAFKYDNLLMEEAAQILEIETFIPMLLQARGHW